MAKLLNTFAPPFKLVGAYFVISIIFAIFSIFLYKFSNFDVVLNLQTATFLHIFLVGFVISIIKGSIYQLSSVILNRAFFTLKGAYINVFVYTVALVLFLNGTFFENTLLIYFGSVMLFLSLLYFDICYLLSFLNLKISSFSQLCLFVSAIMFLIGICFGMLLVLIIFGWLNFDFIMILRFHLYFVFGFIFFTVLGASSVLLPMFSLAHNLNFGLFYASFTLYIFGFFLVWFLPDWALKLILSAAVLAVLQWILILKNRVRKAYDYWNLNLIFSFFMLGFSLFSYYFLSLNLAVFTLFFGFLYPFIVAHIYKIMPFLIWYHYISKFVGKMKVPNLEDMIMKKTAYLGLVFNLIAIVFICFKFEYLAQVFMFVSAILVLVNMINFLKYINFGVKL
ncbi:hypothetical protein [Campylobacter fetus]|uniref:Peptidase M50 n=1 Tax=Campylobacter fetus subsp. testudinum TaxID=1507806 RepID=A0AAX0HA18_CAMFE|nr:hypothetical protein [Campylobacter fetus]OCR90317.1 hypothetical protein CFT12S02225_07220 [Campylobacter fetus subsp. testudinum]